MKKSKLTRREKAIEEATHLFVVSVAQAVRDASATSSIQQEDLKTDFLESLQSQSQIIEDAPDRWLPSGGLRGFVQLVDALQHHVQNLPFRVETVH